MQMRLQLKREYGSCLVPIAVCWIWTYAYQIFPVPHSYILPLALYITHTHTQRHTQTQAFSRKNIQNIYREQDMLGIPEGVGAEFPGNEVPVVTSSQEKFHEVHITSDEHLARQLQAFENILIGTPDNEFDDISSMEPSSQFIERNRESIPAQLEEPLSGVGLNSENVPRELEEPFSDVVLNSENVPREVIQQDNFNTDNMTYEELQSLGEQIGTENRGLSDELISYLPTSKFRTGFFSRKAPEECVVCKTNFKNGQSLITLPCQHRYHEECITQWLQVNKACLVCNEEVFGP